jgi:arylsulfatase A-like enzyme
MKVLGSSTRGSYVELLAIAAWFGILTGLLEGFGMLLFQHINGERWALHVSGPIIWISALVDLAFFCVVALLMAGTSHLASDLPAARTTAVLLTSLAAYDFLTLTARLHSRSRILLAVGVGLAFRRWLVKHENQAVQFWKRTLPWVAIAAMLALVAIQGGLWLGEHQELARLPAAAPHSPNVLVIVVDTLRADHLSSYGYAHPTSPNLDRLASEGLLFENAVSACSWTYPSHVSLVTGRQLFEHGAGRPEITSWFASGGTSFGGYPTIGEALEQLGYHTAAFSANRSFFTGNIGFGRGFIHFEDYYNSPADMFARTLLGKEVLRLYGKWSGRRLNAEWLPYGTNIGLRKRASEINKELLAWIDQSDGAHPFFAFLNYYDVHDPYGVPRPYPKASAGKESDTELYDAGVRYTDDYIGRLLQGLKQRNLDQNTLVIVTSDHGESLGEHGFEGHGRMLYWSLLHVPLIFWYPGHVPSEIRIARPVTNVAIPATLMELLGRHRDSRFPGPALSLLWKNPGAVTGWPDPISELAQNEHIFKEDAALDGRLATAKTGPLKSLITPQWHLITHKKLGDQLYDWVHDPEESNNLAHTPAGKEIVGRLTSEMREALAGAAPAERKIPALPLREDAFGPRGQMVRTVAVPAPVDDDYRLQAEPGSTVVIDVQSSALTPASSFDPVLAITNAGGDPLQTCRNPGDDHTQPPGVPDSTPEAFDDICVNDDIDPSVNADSRLEIAVPGSGGSLVELHVRVFDWNGRVGTGAQYRIAVRSAGRTLPVSTAAAR